MATKRDILRLRKALRHKKRREQAKREWKASYRLERIKRHQVFVTMMKTVAALKAKFKAAQKEAAKKEE